MPRGLDPQLDLQRVVETPYGNGRHADNDSNAITRYDWMWGGLSVCGRLAIGLAGFAPQAKRITNPLQVDNLPHSRGGESPAYRFALAASSSSSWSLTVRRLSPKPARRLPWVPVESVIVAVPIGKSVADSFPMPDEPEGDTGF